MATSEFIESAYRLILNRPPRPGELAVPNQPAGPQAETPDDEAFAALIGQSAEALALPAPIVRLYEAAFGRKPDIGGFDYWTDHLRAEPPLTAARIAELFADSPEFKARFGLGDGSIDRAALIDSLYQKVLGRAPEAEGLAYWLKSSLSVAQLLDIFAQSPEFAARAAAQIQAFFLDIVLPTTNDFTGNDADDYVGSLFSIKKPTTGPAPAPADGGGGGGGGDSGPPAPIGNANAHVVATSAGGQTIYFGDGLRPRRGDDLDTGPDPDDFTDAQDLEEAISKGHPKIALHENFQPDAVQFVFAAKDLEISAAADVETRGLILQLTGSATTLTANGNIGFGGLLGREDVAIRLQDSTTTLPLLQIEFARPDSPIALQLDVSSATPLARFIGLTSTNIEVFAVFAVYNPDPEEFTVGHRTTIDDVPQVIDIVFPSATSTILVKVPLSKDGLDIVYNGQPDPIESLPPAPGPLQVIASGNDVITGSRGQDTIIGGPDGGKIEFATPVNEVNLDIAADPPQIENLQIGDTLTGGDSADIFFYRQGDGVDLINDFDPGVDLLRFCGCIELHLDDVKIDSYDYLGDDTPDTLITFMAADGQRVPDAAIILVGVQPRFKISDLMEQFEG